MKSQIASGAGWMVLFRLIDRSLGVISTLVLARLLVPEDFGLVAMAMSLLAIIELATSFNFEVALIQRAEVQRIHYDTAWTLNVLLAMACGAVTALLAYPTALFYGEPRLTSLLLVLAGGWLLSGLENIGIVDFRRNLDFRREFKFLAVRRALSFALTIALAVSLHSYWALVVGSVGGKLLGVGLSFLMHPFRPRPSVKAARELMSFSGWMLASNLIYVLQIKIPHIVVGRTLGAGPLGLLTVATDIAQLPTSDLIAPINRAVFPGYSRMAEDLALLRATFVDVVAVVVFIAIPAAIGIGAVAEPLVRTMLGDKWIDAVPVIQVLSLASAVAALSSNNVAAYLALGRPRLLTLVVSIRLCILVPTAIVLTRALGLLGAAFAELIASLMLLGVSLPLLFNRLGLSYLPFISRIWRPTVASGLMAAAVHLVLQSMPSESGVRSAIALLAGVVVGVLSYSLAVLLLWQASGRPEGAEAILIRRLKVAWRSTR
jgi:PST family polysaccharide transporter